MDRSQYTSLAEALADVPDPRCRRGVRHPWPLLLTLIGAAMLSGEHHPHAIGQWVHEHAEALIGLLSPAYRSLPSESTLGRALRSVDADALETQLSKFAEGLDRETPSEGGLCGQAIDGKELRGTTPHGRKLRLMSLVCHNCGVVLAQREVVGKQNEIAAVPELIAGRDLTGKVITTDAMLTQKKLARQIQRQGGDYLMEIKRNHPQTHEAIAELFDDPWTARQTGYSEHRSFGKGHGRLERRVLETSTELNEWLRELGWPGVRQVIRRRCERRVIKTGKVSEETHYAVTSLTPKRASAAGLERLWRGHWCIENLVHYVRDVTMGEDSGDSYTAGTPRALAALRNAIIGLLRHKGWKNIADALRHYGASVQRALGAIGALTS